MMLFVRYFLSRLCGAACWRGRANLGFALRVVCQPHYMVAAREDRLGNHSLQRFANTAARPIERFRPVWVISEGASQIIRQIS